MSSGNCAQCGHQGWRRPVGLRRVEVAERKVSVGSREEQRSWPLEPSVASGRDGRPQEAKLRLARGAGGRRMRECGPQSGDGGVKPVTQAGECASVRAVLTRRWLRVGSQTWVWSFDPEIVAPENTGHWLWRGVCRALSGGNA